MSKLELNRRDALVLGGAVLVGAPVSSALAKAPFTKQKAAGFYSFALGDAQISVVSDGPIGFGDGRKLMAEVSMEEMAKRLEANFLPTDKMFFEQNITVVNTGSKLVVIDTGLGTTKMFGETQGRLPANLAAAGINAADVDVVVISHGHPDHIGGILDASGKPVFPNATYFVTETDFKFWTDEANLGNKDLKPLIEFARATLLPIKDKISFFKGGQEIVTGITAIDAPGHTMGHMIFMVSSGGKSICVTSDVGHHYVLMVETPKIEFAYDIDKKLAVATRLKTWDMLATDRIPFISYHFPWPGLGNLVKTGPEAYRFVATPVDTL